MILFHYTCRHSLAEIEADGMTLRPNPHVASLGLPEVVWLTDMETPDRWALGLTSETLSCDRTEYRLTVIENDHVMSWSKWCRANGFTRAQRDRMETHTARPRHWFVSSESVRAVKAERLR